MNTFRERLKILLKIYSIPLEENWGNWGNSSTYTVYKYWSNLGLINQEQYENIFIRKTLDTNPIINRFFNSFNYHFKPKYYKNGLVADVGSGFGFITFWLILNGASIVHSIGDPERISFIERLYNSAVEKDLLPAGKLFFKPEFIKKDDNTLSNTIKNNTLSMVLLNDTLEHITPRIFPYLASSAYNNLKPSGRIVSRQQNTDSNKMLNKLKKEWDNIEEKEYIQQRSAIISNNIPQINSKDCKILAKNTRGLDREGFYFSINEFKLKGTIPKYLQNSPPIDIKIDVPFEGDTSIERISMELKQAGFSKIFVYFDVMSSRRTKLFQPIIKLFSTLFSKTDYMNETSVFVAKK